jgi:ornithine cyclodeaminase/alanine dehydrogenase-like protein (mu-crystallin family)
LKTVSEAQVRALLPMPEAVRLMRETFTALREHKAQNQPRRRLFLSSGSTLHALAGAFGDYFGTKVYATNPRHGAYFYFLLFDAATARPLALMEANWLGQIRTGAASGYATDLLARSDASFLGIIGSGFQARSQLEAIRCVRNIREVRVWSRSAEKRRQFAAECGAIAVETAEAAVRHADIVVTATFSKDPVLEDSWIAPGTHINAIGSNYAQRRELPAELVNRAGVIVVDSIEQSRIESGDLILAGVDWSRVVELCDVQARESAEAVTIFKSNGLGVEDVAAAAYVYERLRSS